MNFNKNDKVEIIKDRGGLKVGDIGIIRTGERTKRGNYVVLTADESDCWWVNDTEMKLIKENNTFYKDDLKQFMRIKYRNGNIRIVTINRERNFSSANTLGMNFNSYTNTLKEKNGNDSFDVVSVFYQPLDERYILDENKVGGLIWSIKTEKEELQHKLEEAEKIVREVREQLSESNLHKFTQNKNEFNI